MSTVLDISSLKGSKLGFKMDIPKSIRLLKDGESLKSGQGVMRIPTPDHGDERVVWDSGEFEQIRDAKEVFDKLVLQGLVPYRVGTNGRATSDVMDEFDPHAEEIIFIPISMVVGG